MLVIPAIDLKGGRCVRLLHGEAEKETVYSTDPVAMARKWLSAGAKRLHVIDLDGAFTGQPHNLEWVIRIKNETGASIQMGGGLRTLEVIERVLKAGIDRVILGTVVVEEAGLAKEVFDKYKDRIMVALDAKGDRVAIHGWKGDSGFPLDEAIRIVEKLGGKEIIFTDIGRDGTLVGANVDAVKRVMDMTDLAVYAAGGVSSLADVVTLKKMKSPGCIVGKAIYENKLDLAQAIRSVEA